MPARIPYAIARTGPAAALRLLMEEPPLTTVAVHGPPGTGKTLLAADYAREFAAAGGRVAWFSSARTDLLVEQLAGIARDAIGETPPGTVAADEVFGALTRNGPWLVVFDDASDSAQIAPFVQSAQRAGMRVLITSRSPRFRQLARGLELAGFDRSDSTRLLLHFVDQLPRGDADAIAEALGDLPLALVQAGEHLQGSAMTAAHYLKSLKTNTASAAKKGGAPAYSAPLGASVAVALERLARKSPSAVQLLRLCACFASSPIPFAMLAEGYAHLPFDVRAGLGVDPTLGLAATVSAASDSGLLRSGYGYCELLSPFNVVLRAGLDAEESADQARRARAILSLADPGDPRDSATWPGYQELLPHVFELGLSRAPEPSSRRLVLNVAGYLSAVGDAQAALKIADEAVRAWEERSGRDAADTLAALSRKAQACFQTGDYLQAVTIDDEVFTRRRGVLGDDHPDTIESMADLAVDLTAAGRAAGAHGADLLARAGELHRAVVAVRKRRSPDGGGLALLRSTHNLAFHHRAIADYEGARSIEEEVYGLCLRQLGDHDPLTLKSAHALAHDLRRAGDYGRARTIEETAFNGYRDTLGPDHSETLRAAQFLVRDLRAAGEHERARTLHMDTVKRLERGQRR